MPWHKVKPASRYAGISERLFRDWIKEGLRHVRMPSGLILCKERWIDEYLQQFESQSDEVDQIVNEVIEGIN